ncbi:MAG: HAMP domain-containing histidine kinase [Ruminococcaceae bacterium]|nr:HAMP domain-containing histidine kinase [Oscillospiraceae bacterium]
MRKLKSPVRAFKRFKRFRRSSTFIKYYISIFVSMLIVLVVLGVSLLLFIAQYWRENNFSVLKENVNTLSQTATEYFELDSDGQYINDPTVTLAYSLSLVSTSIESDIYICNLNGNVLLCKDIVSSIRLENTKPYCEIHSKIKIPKRIIDEAVKGDFQTSEDIPELGEKISLMVGEPIKANGKVIAVIIGTQPELDNTYPFVSSVLKMFLSSALVAFVVAFVAIYIVTYSITKPLRKMSQITKEYATGDFSRRIEIKGTNELADLGHALNSMAQSLSKLEDSRRSFIANVSHELKTPMTSIGGFIDGILDGTISAEEEEKYLKVVSNEVKRLARLVSSMLNLSKIEAGELSLNLKRTDISAMIFNTLLSFEQSINQKSIDITGLDSMDNLYVNIDKDLINQVVYNLVDNAVKFTENGGYINVRATQDDDFTTVIIKNSGAGIPTDEIERIFERFYKVDKSRSLDTKSTGLGLYIVKSIVEMHGGTVDASSQTGKYTEFRFSLPNV